jgi:hypothetical protein
MGGEMHRFAFGLGAAVLALLCVQTARSETLTISGWYAAEERDASLLRVLSVDRFDGDDGASLVYEIERELRAALDRDRKPYFDIKSRYAKADGVVHGDVRTRIDNVNFTRKVKRCSNDIYSTKCKDEEKIQVDLYCIRRMVVVSANVQITRLSDDARIYSRNLPQRHESESCEGEKKANDIDNVINTLVRRVADEFGNQITPTARTEKIRVRESLKGMAKEDSKQMKSLLAATKKSESAACAGWRDMESRGVSHPTLLFNLGLCSEMAGDLDAALNYYRPLAVAQKAIDANDALRRIERREAGEADAIARASAAVKP